MARLAYCSECKSISRLDDRLDPDPDNDPVGHEWVKRHWHGGRTEAAFADCPDLPDDWSHSQHVTQFKEALLSNNPHYDVHELRDEIKDDALSCFRKHDNPSYDGRRCIDYHSDAKRLGVGELPAAARRYLCDFCPYEESVRVEKRWRAGQYK
jgi:hypothetical protein